MCNRRRTLGNQKGESTIPRRKREELPKRRRSPARTAESRELELASDAYDLAEKQIQAGTASSQVITHFLKMGSTRERLEQQRIQHENELMEVKRQQIEGQKRVEELYLTALEAMRSYSGQVDQPDEDL
jgi:hypothetical protein